MADVLDDDGFRGVINRVYDAVLPHPQSVQVLRASELGRLARQRFFGEGLNPGPHALDYWP